MKDKKQLESATRIMSRPHKDVDGGWAWVVFGATFVGFFILGGELVVKLMVYFNNIGMCFSM